MFRMSTWTEEEKQQYKKMMDAFTSSTLYKHILLYNADGMYKRAVDSLGADAVVHYLQTSK